MGRRPVGSNRWLCGRERSEQEHNQRAKPAAPFMRTRSVRMNGARGERHPGAARPPQADLASTGRSRRAVSAPVSSSAERSDADGSHLAPHSAERTLR